MPWQRLGKPNPTREAAHHGVLSNKHVQRSRKKHVFWRAKTLQKYGSLMGTFLFRYICLSLLRTMPWTQWLGPAMCLSRCQKLDLNHYLSNHYQPSLEYCIVVNIYNKENKPSKTFHASHPNTPPPFNLPLIPPICGSSHASGISAAALPARSDNPERLPVGFPADLPPAAAEPRSCSWQRHPNLVAGWDNVWLGKGGEWTIMISQQ